MIEWDQNEYKQAFEHFEKFTGKYPFSVLYSKVLYHEAMCLMVMNDRARCKELLIAVEQRFPHTVWSHYAHQRLAEYGLKQ